MSKQRLSWGLVVATYNRSEILEQSIQLALAQSRPPAEVIIIDASPDWKATRDRISAKISNCRPEIRWEFRKAERPSLTAQRNQGISLARADVIFLLDDDSLMYPDCAEKIVAIYEADEMCAIAGVQAQLADTPPQEYSLKDRKQETGRSYQEFLWRIVPVWVHDFILRRLFIMDHEELFIPYAGGYPDHPVPAHIATMEVKRERLFHGCRMTFRRSVLIQEQFEPLLLSYSPGEDLDFSYRASRHGCLLTARGAYLNHFQVATGRIKRFEVAFLYALNQAFFLRRNSPDLKSSRRRYFRLMARRALAEVLKDLLSRRWSLPQVRGLMAAFKPARLVFAMSDAELAASYPRIQEDILASSRISSFRP